MRNILIVAVMAFAVTASQAAISPLHTAKNDVAKVISMAAPCKGPSKAMKMEHVVAFDRHTIALRTHALVDGFVADQVTYKADMRRLFTAKFYGTSVRPSEHNPHVALNCRQVKCFNQFRDGLRPHQTRTEKSSVNITLCSGNAGRPDPALTQRLSVALNNLIQVARLR